MISEESKAVIARSKEIYERIKRGSEEAHKDRFVAIEPDSGEHFLGDTFDEVVSKAGDAHPAKLTHTIRIGHVAAFHLGVPSQ